MPVIREHPFADGLGALNVGRDIKLGGIVRPTFDIGIANAAPANAADRIRGKYLASDAHGSLVAQNEERVYSGVSETTLEVICQDGLTDYALGVHDKQIGLLWVTAMGVTFVSVEIERGVDEHILVDGVTYWMLHTDSTLRMYAIGIPSTVAYVRLFTFTK